MLTYMNGGGDPAHPPKLDQGQSRGMGCGHESVRQVCIQMCHQKKIPPGSPGCEACNQSEIDWYKKYIEKMKETHNTEAEAKKKEVIKENDEKWDRLKKAGKGFVPQGTFDPSERGWRDYQGQTVRIRNSTGDPLYIEPLPAEVMAEDVDKQVFQGQVGSFPKTRKDMLESWCGIPSEPGENTPVGVGEALANGGTVITPVDVGVLQGRGKEGGHVVTVSRMSFDKDGKLVSVVVNDTADNSPGGCCGLTIPGATFERALLPGRQTNIVK
jgi:hypothetical protein